MRRRAARSPASSRRCYRKNGDVIWISENARAVFDEDGTLVCYEGTVEDITERKLYQARIEQQANYDTLTGLANRSLLARSSAARHPIAAAAGTALVSRSCSSISIVSSSSTTVLAITLAMSCCVPWPIGCSSCVRDCDTVARLGGDEFVLLINGRTGRNAVADGARAHALRYLAAVDDPAGRFQCHVQYRRCAVPR